MNAYWKHNLKNSIKSTKSWKLINPVNNINDLTSKILDSSTHVHHGRSWRADELRIKSDSDLHKLWYVLLKEKLALKSDTYKLAQNILEVSNKKNFTLRACSRKVHVSMTRLRTIMNERYKLRNEFMMFLEFYYIRKKQLNPEYKILSDVNLIQNRQDTVTAQIQPVVTKVNTKKVVIRGILENKENTNEEPGPPVELNVESDKIDETVTAEITTSTPLIPLNNEENINNDNSKVSTPVNPSKEDEVSVLNSNEIKQVEKLKKKYKTLNSFLDDYIRVEDRKQLRGKEKRRVTGIINAARSSQAKNIFMKEMAALSYKLKNTQFSKNENLSKLENIS